MFASIHFFRTGFCRQLSMSQENWLNDSIQFPRLISEIEAVGAFDLLQRDGTKIIDSIAISMDLEPWQIYELIDRAQQKWDSIKSQTFAPADAGDSQ
jgi:hypothetical protein